MGALLDSSAVHPARSGRDHLRAMALTQRIPRARVDEVLALTGMTDAARRRAGTYSLGMKQRLGIAGALLGDPEVLMLDEPVNGLDPDGVRWIRTLLRSLAEEGRTVFVSSHLMSEMQQTADRLVVIGRGRLIADEPMDSLLTGAGTVVRGPALQPLADRVRRRPLDRRHRARPSPASPPDQVGATAHRLGLMLHGLAPIETTLEESYMKLTADSLEFGAEV